MEVLPEFVPLGSERSRIIDRWKNAQYKILCFFNALFYYILHIAFECMATDGRSTESSMADRLSGDCFFSRCVL